MTPPRRTDAIFFTYKKIVLVVMIEKFYLLRVYRVAEQRYQNVRFSCMYLSSLACLASLNTVAISL